MALQPLSNIPEWTGETACRTLWNMTQRKLNVTGQNQEVDSGEKQGDNSKGST